MDAALKLRQRFVQEFNNKFAPETVLCFPTLPGKAPRRDGGNNETDTFRTSGLQLLCIASLLGGPQLVIPTRQLGNALSFFTSPHLDRELLSWLMTLDIETGRNATS